MFLLLWKKNKDPNIFFCTLLFFPMAFAGDNFTNFPNQFFINQIHSYFIKKKNLIF